MVIYLIVCHLVRCFNFSDFTELGTNTSYVCVKHMMY